MAQTLREALERVKHFEGLFGRPYCTCKACGRRQFIRHLSAQRMAAEFRAAQMACERQNKRNAEIAAMRAHTH